MVQLGMGQTASQPLFNSYDYPVDTHFYWIRWCNFKEVTPARQLVYTKNKVCEVSDNYIATYLKTPKMKHHNVWSISIEEFSELSEKGAYVPEYLFKALRGEAIDLDKLNRRQRLSVFLGTTGNYELDVMIREVKYSFIELHEFSKKMREEGP